MKKLILASKSPYRKQLLQRLGIDFDCVPSKVDEKALKSQISSPIELTQELSLAKAKAVLKNFQDAIIIGSDQVCYFDGRILGKTGSLDISFQQLKEMSGKEHKLITSYAIIDSDRQTLHTNETILLMRELSDVQIKNYLSTDNPIDCAGSYKLELNGISLFKKISTNDHTAIIGLPLLNLGTDLLDWGISVPGDEGR